MDLLMANEWKGNVRELANVIERSVIFAEDEIISAKALGLAEPYAAHASGCDDDLVAAVKVCEKHHILRVLKKFNYDKTQAARALGVGLSSLYRKMDELDIRLARSRA
jgi:DNA-binding NtrC family response regulator